MKSATKGFEITAARSIQQLNEADLSVETEQYPVDKIAVQLVNDIINTNLSEYSSEWFTEFSLLSTTLIDKNNQNSGKLRCVSFIEGSLEFKEAIDNCVNPILKVLFENKQDDWWFYNPETFIAPTSTNIYVSLGDHRFVESGEGMTDLQKSCYAEIKKAINNEITSPSVDRIKYKRVDNRNLFMSVMEYDREFTMMMNESSQIYKKYKAETHDTDTLNYKLITSYRKGVEEAKCFYDTFVSARQNELLKIKDNSVIEEQDADYGYITFPIIASSSDGHLPQIYLDCFDEEDARRRLQGQGHCFIYFKIIDKDKIDLKDMQQRIRKMHLEIHNCIHWLSLNYTFNIGYSLKEKSDKISAGAKKEATKAAKAAIMSRNMSHNLGSHVMAYLKQKLNSVEDIVREKTLADLIYVVDDKNCKFNDGFTNSLRTTLANNLTGTTASQPNLIATTDITTKIELPFLVGLGKFVNYLQERQDFIATVATNYIPYSSPVNFKDYIYDELTPDLRQIRHSDRSGSRPENILLAYIARSENIIREVPYEDEPEVVDQEAVVSTTTETAAETTAASEVSTATTPDSEGKKEKKNINHRSISTVMDYVNAKDIIKLTFRKFMGVIEPEVKSSKEYSDYYKKFTKEQNADMVDSLEEMKNYNFSLPGGVIGRQAIFSIIENIIRNAAKHGIRTDVDNVELAFDIFDLASPSDVERIEAISKDDMGVTDALMPDYTIDQDAMEARGFVDDKGKIFAPDYKHLQLSFQDLLLGEESPYKSAKDINELYVFTITDNLDIQIPALCKLCSAINTKYLDEQTGTMENTAKGLKEIRISAGWLRILDDSIEGALDKRAPLVTVRAARTSENKFNLQYILCIPKPRNVAFITSAADDTYQFIPNGLSKEQESKLRDQLTLNGWEHFTEAEWCDSATNKSFDIIVVESESEAKASALERVIGGISPDRIVRLTTEDIKRLHMAALESHKDENGNLCYNFIKAQEYLWNKMLLQKERMKNEIITLEGNSLVYANADELAHDEVIHIEDSRAYENFYLNGAFVKDAEARVAKINDYDIYFKKALKQVIIHPALNSSVKPEDMPEDQPYGPKYLYRTHHGFEENNPIKSYLKQSLILSSGAYTNTQFIEGITGHNATDRIVRSIDIDLTWYFRQISAMQTKVAVIDERIFRKITGVNDDEVVKDINESGSEISILNCLKTKDKTALLYLEKGISAMNIILKSSASNDEIIKAKNSTKDADPVIAEFAVVGADVLYIPGYEEIRQKEYKALDAARAAEGPDERSPKQKRAEDKQRREFLETARISHLCTISITLNGNVEIAPAKEFSDRCIFDYLTIHQGLLDKIYNKISNIDADKKEIVTNKLKAIFIANSKEYGNLVIHSGRSKPSLKDMPQAVPFVQFSGIDSSVSDSKTTLVELLNFARYEDNNN